MGEDSSILLGKTVNTHSGQTHCCHSILFYTPNEAGKLAGHARVLMYTSKMQMALKERESTPRNNIFDEVPPGEGKCRLHFHPAGAAVSSAKYVAQDLEQWCCGPFVLTWGSGGLPGRARGRCCTMHLRAPLRHRESHLCSSATHVLTVVPSCILIAQMKVCCSCATLATAAALRFPYATVPLLTAALGGDADRQAWLRVHRQHCAFHFCA